LKYIEHTEQEVLQ